MPPNVSGVTSSSLFAIASAMDENRRLQVMICLKVDRPLLMAAGLVLIARFIGESYGADRAFDNLS
jgi:hypothetical protein